MPSSRLTPYHSWRGHSWSDALAVPLATGSSVMAVIPRSGRNILRLYRAKRVPSSPIAGRQPGLRQLPWNLSYKTRRTISSRAEAFTGRKVFRQVNRNSFITDRRLIGQLALQLAGAGTYGAGYYRVLRRSPQMRTWMEAPNEQVNRGTRPRRTSLRPY